MHYRLYAVFPAHRAEQYIHGLNIVDAGDCMSVSLAVTGDCCPEHWIFCTHST